MNLNLQIIKDEFKDLEFQAHYTSGRNTYPLAYASIYAGEGNLAEHILYIVKAEEIPDVDSDSGCFSFVCIGMPSEKVLRSRCNILYTQNPVTGLELLNQLQRIFYRYYQWEMEMCKIIEENLQLDQFGAVSHPFFNNPLLLQDDRFFVFFHEIGEITVKSSKKLWDYEKKFLQENNEFYDLEEINLIISDPEFNRLSRARKPIIFSDVKYGFRVLNYNIFINDVYYARLSVDEVEHIFTDRDFALIQILGEYIKRAIIRRNTGLSIQPEDTNVILKCLLEHKLVPEHKITSILRYYGWEMQDTFFCMYMEPRSGMLAKENIHAAILQISLCLPKNYYVFFEESAAFVLDISSTKYTRDEIIHYVLPKLRDSLLFISVSTEFHDFKEIYYYYNQAVFAMKMGQKYDENGWIFRYEDHNLRYIVSKCQEKNVLSALVPVGLQKLIRYDQEKNTDYTQLLKTYLKNNMSIADTIKCTYIHRNTFLYRIEKIKDIVDMDLDDPDVRLELLISYKILEMNGISW